MTLELKVQLVENLFARLERESAQFQLESGIQCVSGCGKCCTHSNIEASPLEFLPWAYHLFLSGKAEEILAELNETDKSTCFLFTPISIMDAGRCTTYQYRGLICRLFGFAANRDKYGKMRLATCKIIKEGQADNYRSASKAIIKDLYVPVFTDYYMQLTHIDFHMANLILPVNEALKMALEEVSQYYAYRPVPYPEEC